jgi:hypothetical protein
MHDVVGVDGFVMECDAGEYKQSDAEQGEDSNQQEKKHDKPHFYAGFRDGRAAFA